MKFLSYISSPEYQRFNHWINFRLYPWLSLPAFAAAVVMSAIYRPPVIATTAVLVLSLLGGAGYACWMLTGRKKWAHLMGAAWMSVIVAQKFGIFDGRFYTMLAWMIFGMLAPFWIWRKRGMEKFAPVENGAAE